MEFPTGLRYRLCFDRTFHTVYISDLETLSFASPAPAPSK